jgi:hypothetical protein
MKAVENQLLKVIETKDLAGTGFYSPPAGAIYPQELPRDEDFPWE